MYMYANAQTYMNMQLVCSSKNIWADLTYEFGPICLINLGQVLCESSWFWGELSVFLLIYLLIKLTGT